MSSFSGNRSLKAAAPEPESQKELESYQCLLQNPGRFFQSAWGSDTLAQQVSSKHSRKSQAFFWRDRLQPKSDYTGSNQPVYPQSSLRRHPTNPSNFGGLEDQWPVSPPSVIVNVLLFRLLGGFFITFFVEDIINFLFEILAVQLPNHVTFDLENIKGTCKWLVLEFIQVSRSLNGMQGLVQLHVAAGSLPNGGVVVLGEDFPDLREHAELEEGLLFGQELHLEVHFCEEIVIDIGVLGVESVLGMDESEVILLQFDSLLGKFFLEGECFGGARSGKGASQDVSDHINQVKRGELVSYKLC